MISRKSDGQIVQWLSNQTLCYVGIMSVLHFHYVFSTISTYRMTFVVLFLAEAWIFLFTSASWLALGATGFPVDSAVGKAKSAWIYHLNAVSRQILLTTSLSHTHIFSWVCVQGSTASTFEVFAKTAISKVGDAPVGAASGWRHGGYLNHSQFWSADHFWIPMWGSPEARSVPLWWPLLDTELVLKFVKNAPVWEKYGFLHGHYCNRELGFEAVLCGSKLTYYSFRVSGESALFIFRPELSNFTERGRMTKNQRNCTYSALKSPVEIHTPSAVTLEKSAFPPHIAFLCPYESHIKHRDSPPPPPSIYQPLFYQLGGPFFFFL